MAITSDIALHEYDAADATPGRTAPEEDSAKLLVDRARNKIFLA